MVKILRPDITTSQDLSSAALNFVTTLSQKFKLLSVTIHASQAITETITITKDSNEGANYDTVLRTADLVSAQDFVYRPPAEEEAFQDGDELRVECTDANGVGTVYATIKVRDVD